MGDGARPLALVSRARDVLATARAHILRPQEEISPKAVDSSINAVIQAVEARLPGAEQTETPAEFGSDSRFAHVLHALEEAVIDIPADAPTAAAAIEVLRAIGEVRSATSPGDSSVGSRHDRLRHRLQAPDAFELLVEVAHDFRSPLTSILFLSETLRDGNSGPVTEHQRSQLGLVYSAAFGLASIASDIMDLARNGSALVDTEPATFRLEEVFQGVERLVRPIVEEKGLELRFSYPSLASTRGHPHAVSRVLLNLATNALKFTDSGWVEVGARVRPRSRLEYYVQDTGRGIPLERQRELFEPFKVRSGDARGGHFFSGSGVGLSIARRLVEAMGSELHFETSDDRGTRFWFDVPVDAASRATR